MWVWRGKGVDIEKLYLYFLFSFLKCWGHCFERISFLYNTRKAKFYFETLEWHPDFSVAYEYGLFLITKDKLFQSTVLGL
jgi:hypothetical protein